MSNKTGAGGFHFGDVDGNVNLHAGGDLVGGNKTTTITKGFASEGQKAQFQTQIDHLSETLRALKGDITANAKLNTDQKVAMEAVISQKLFTLGQVKDHVGAVPAGENAATDFVNKIDGALSSADGMIDKLKSFAGKSEDVAETVGKFAAKYGPLLLSARRLFGLP